MLLQALGACRVQKLRRKSWNILRFNRNSRFLNAKSRDKNHHRAQENLRILCSARQMIIGGFRAPRVRVGGRNRADFENFACKIARFSIANLRIFGAARARKTQEKRADSFQRLSTPRHALLRF